MIAGGDGLDIWKVMKIYLFLLTNAQYLQFGFLTNCLTFYFFSIKQVHFARYMLCSSNISIYFTINAIAWKI